MSKADVDDNFKRYLTFVRFLSLTAGDYYEQREEK